MICTKVHSFKGEIDLSMLVEEVTGRFSRDSPEKWRSPPPDYVKMNIDISISKSEKVACSALVLRDGDGSFLAARTVPDQFSPNSLVAETISLPEALSWVKYQGNPRVIVETDYLGVVQGIGRSSRRRYNTELGYMFQEISSLLSRFIDCPVKHVNL